MPIFRRRPAARREEPDGPPPEEAVRMYLRGQNLESLGRVDEARDLYERGVAARFDSAGPYDRLIAIYRDRSAHDDVVRVASAALESVRAFAAKREWYERMRDEAAQSARERPDARGAEF